MTASGDEISPGAQGAGVSTGADRLRYLLFLPASYRQEPGKAWPLILYLHGLGEAGSEITTVKRTGLSALVEKRPDFPFITLSPQCPDERGWLPRLPAVVALLEEIMGSYVVDESRVYLTGNSMGGEGSWGLAAHAPERFAAVAPICGWGKAALGCKLKDVPVWAFHGGADEIVPVEGGRAMVEAVRACGGQAQLTVYPGVGHDSWTRTYADPAFYGWLMGQRRSMT